MIPFGFSETALAPAGKIRAVAIILLVLEVFAIIETCDNCPGNFQPQYSHLFTPICSTRFVFLAKLISATVALVWCQLLICRPTILDQQWLRCCESLPKMKPRHLLAARSEFPCSYVLSCLQNPGMCCRCCVHVCFNSRYIINLTDTAHTYAVEIYTTTGIEEYDHRIS